MNHKNNRLSGIIVAIAIFILIASTILSLFYVSEEVNFSKIWSDKYIRHISFFSLYQAFLSTLLSIIFSIPLALALYRREFAAKKWLLRLFSLSFVLPVLIAVFGIVAIYGNSGILNSIFEQKLFNIYGLSGILIAHLFFNIPLSTKIIHQNLKMINTQQHKLSTNLGISSFYKFKFIEWPIIKQQIPHIAALIFMLCFTSFAIVLALGGGPKSTTIEVAIYQAIKYDFDFSLAALLSIWQIVLCLIVILISQKYAKPIKNQSNSENNINIFIDSKKLRFFDSFAILLAMFFILPPLISIFALGLNENFFANLSNIELYKALYHSLSIASCSTILSLFFAICIVLTSTKWKLLNHNKKSNTIELIGMIILLTPSLVLSTGLFILLNNKIDVFNNAFYLIVLINALMALPFVIRSLSQGFFNISQEYEQLCLSLGIQGFSRLRLIEFKALKSTFANAIAISFVLSLGDLSAIALFGSPDYKTLPLLLYEQMGSYQMSNAAVTALFLLILSFIIFTLVEKQLTKEKNAKS